MSIRLIGALALGMALAAAEPSALPDAESLRVLKGQNELFALEIKRLQAALAAAEAGVKVAEAGCALNATVAAVTPSGYELTPELKLKPKPITTSK